MELPHKPILPSRPRPVCVIGAGGIVRDAHLPAYRRAGFPVAAIWNRGRARAEALADRFQIPLVARTLDELIARAPPGAIFDMALMSEQFAEVLERLPEGAPVLIQKPMGSSLAEARRILEVCHRRRLVAAVNCQLRFAPFVAATRWLLQQGLLGQLYDLEVRVTVATPWELFPYVKVHPRLELAHHSIHYLDLVRWFLGNPRSVHAVTVGHPEKPMSSTRSTVVLDYGGAVRAVVHTNHDHDFGPEEQESFIKWEGTRGAVKATMGLLRDYPRGVPDRYAVCLREPGRAARWEEIALEGTWFPDAFIGSMAALMRFVEGSTPALQTGVEDVIDTMAVVEAAYRSSAEGGVRPEYA